MALAIINTPFSFVTVKPYIFVHFKNYYEATSLRTLSLTCSSSTLALRYSLKGN